MGRADRQQAQLPAGLRSDTLPIVAGVLLHLDETKK
jgi:hypothetical protein